MRSKEKLYGTLRFNCMIPVPGSELSEYKINDKGDFNYKTLMLAEYNFFKIKDDTDFQEIVKYFEVFKNFAEYVLDYDGLRHKY